MKEKLPKKEFVNLSESGKISNVMNEPSSDRKIEGLGYRVR
jgi:hypothetical protein